jgi:DNA-directed RNA polymerase alpha subunit
MDLVWYETPSIVEYEPYSTFNESRLVARFRASMAQVNELRKTVLLDVPTWAIDSCLVLENTTSQHDDTLMQRLGLVPLVPTVSDKEPDQVAFYLFAQAADAPLRVMSGHL